LKAFLELQTFEVSTVAARMPAKTGNAKLELRSRKWLALFAEAI
jgi:hypothetical protein